MDVLVLGGTRLMGKHLVNALLEKGHRITVATRGITEDDFGDRVTRVLVDRCSQDFIIMVPQNAGWAALIEQCYGEKAKK